MPMPEKLQPATFAGKPAAAPPDSVRSRWRRLLKGCLLSVLGLAAMAGIAGGCWYRDANRRNRAFSAHVRELIAAEAAAHPAVPDEENAAPLYAKAFALYVKPASQDFYRNLNDESRDFTSAEVVQYLAANRAYREALGRAVARPKCDFRPDLSQGLKLNIPQVVELRAAGRHVGIACRYEVQSGNPGKAQELLKSVLRISRDAGSDEIPLSRMAQVACEGIFLNALQSVSGESGPEAAAVEKLLAEVERYIEERRDMAPTMRREKLGLLATIDAVLAGRMSLGDLADHAGEDSPPRTTAATAFARLSGGLRAAGYDIERLLDEHSSAAVHPYPQALREARSIMARMEAEDRNNRASRTIVKGLLVAHYSLFVESDARSLARLQAARLALGCKLHKLRTGAWPASLADLQKAFPERFKELPADPFTGGPFVYRLTENGCLVYSLGPNAKDDGGAAYDAKTRTVNFDLPFELKK